MGQQPKSGPDHWAQRVYRFGRFGHAGRRFRPPPGIRDSIQSGVLSPAGRGRRLYHRLVKLSSGYLDRHLVFPEKIHEVARLVQEKKGLTVSRFRTRKDLYRLVPKLRDLYNQAVEGTSGNTPLTDDEALTMADQMIWFADPAAD